LCGMVTKPQLRQLDYNVYVRTFEDNASALIQWCTFENNDCKTLFLNSVDELQKINPEYSVHSKYFPNYHGPLFKGIEVGNYQLLKSFPGSNDAAVLPSEISKLLGQTGKYFGAYPPVQ